MVERRGGGVEVGLFPRKVEPKPSLDGLSNDRGAKKRGDCISVDFSALLRAAAVKIFQSNGDALSASCAAFCRPCGKWWN